MNLYYCYLLIQSYWTPIVGAVLASVVLRRLKRVIADDIMLVTDPKSPVFWKKIPLLYAERFKKYFSDLWTAMKKRFWPSESTAPPTPDHTSSGRSHKRKRRTDLRASSPTLPRDAIGSSPSTGSQPRVAAPKKRVRTFPFLVVLLGIVLAFALSLPIVVYLAVALLLIFVMVCHVILYVSGLNGKFSKFIFRNSDTIATIVTIIILLSSGAMLGAFFLVNCSLEATKAATDLYSFVDTQVFSNPEFQAYVASLGLQAEAKEAADQVYQWYLEKRHTLEATGLGRVISAFNFAELSGEGSVTKRFATHLMMSYSNVSINDVETMIQSAGFTGFKIYDLQCVFFFHFRRFRMHPLNVDFQRSLLEADADLQRPEYCRIHCRQTELLFCHLYALSAHQRLCPLLCVFDDFILPPQQQAWCYLLCGTNPSYQRTWKAGYS
jgi:low affinity Fe/Cu permease